ncbi:MAG: YeeE/YedE thiosulfate transporter family protein [Desulfurivibrio sp.]|nr:YeeE/YedE thiosulfate transporter family protein [Desulfurivibrio sp.]
MLTATPIVLAAAALGLGVLVGNLLYRGDFCMVAMWRDFFLFRQTTLLRIFVLYVLVAAFLFNLGVASGWLLYPPPNLHAASLTTIGGGLIFGIGMVLAGGCVLGTLYKMAAGNLTNGIAFIGILLGSLLYAEIHPQVSAVVAWTTLTTQVTLAENDPMLRGLLLAAILLGGGILVGRWWQRGELQVVAYAEGYLQPWKVVLGLALLNFFYYALTGTPMGVTTAYAKLAGYLASWWWPEHVASLAYFNTESISWRQGEVIISGGAGPQLDYIAYSEGALVGGIFLGALATACYYREFRIYGLPPRRQAVFALLGGVLLALGARVAGGCNVKFFLGGLPLLAWQGIYFTLAAVVGCYLGSEILRRYIIPG